MPRVNARAFSAAKAYTGVRAPARQDVVRQRWAANIGFDDQRAQQLANMGTTVGHSANQSWR